MYNHRSSDNVYFKGVENVPRDQQQQLKSMVTNSRQSGAVKSFLSSHKSLAATCTRTVIDKTCGQTCD